MRIVDLTARDIRYPTSLQADGSDASHPDPDYSMVYVQLVTDVNGGPIGTGLALSDFFVNTTTTHTHTHNDNQ